MNESPRIRYLFRRVGYADVQHEVQPVRTRVGSIQSLRSQGKLPGVRQSGYSDLADRVQLHESEESDGSSTQEHEPSISKEDKKFRQ